MGGENDNLGLIFFLILLFIGLCMLALVYFNYFAPQEKLEAKTKPVLQRPEATIQIVSSTPTKIPTLPPLPTPVPTESGNGIPPLPPG